MIVKPIFQCKKEKTWRLFTKEFKGLEVQRAPQIGESISLGHGIDYKVIDVCTDLYQDDIFLSFKPLSIKDFIFIFWDQHDIEANINRRWQFETSTGDGENEQKKFLQLVIAYDKKVDEELGE